MKKIISALSALLFTTTLAFVGQVEADTAVQFGIGYRTDYLSSEIGAPDEVRLNTFSKLKFKDLEIFTISAKLKSTCGDCAYYRAYAQYGWILDGDVRESDQIAQISSGPLTPSTVSCSINPVFHNDVTGRYVADFDIAIGYPLQQCLCEGLQLVPTLGFAYDTIRLRSKNHDQLSTSDRTAFVLNDSDRPVVDACSSSTSSSSECDPRNKLRATVWGPFIGLDFAYNNQDCCWNLYGEFEFQWARARRERNSHLGLHHIDHYRRSRQAWGWKGKIGSIYFFRCNWYLDGNISYRNVWSHKHHDELKWRSYAVELALGYTF